MRKILLFSAFVLGNLSILTVSFLFLTILTTKQSSATPTAPLPTVVMPQSTYPSFSSLPASPDNSSAQILAADARPVLIDNFFTHYGSPMTGLGHDIVAAADHNQIPYWLLPAIAQCEGNLGKVMPGGSFNPYGFGIYADKVTRFSSWQEGINIVSQTLRQDYFDQGLTTPETIMAKYTPSSNGSWAFCVNHFLTELK